MGLDPLAKACILLAAAWHHGDETPARGIDVTHVLVGAQLGIGDIQEVGAAGHRPQCLPHLDVGDRVAGIAVGTAKRSRNTLGGDGEDEQQLAQIRAVVLGKAKGNRWRRASAQLAAGRRPVLAAEGDRGRVVVQPIEGHPEALPHRDHHRGEQGRPIGIEEPIERAPDPVVGQPRHLRRVDAEASRCKTVHGLLLAIDGLALDQDRAQQHAECLRVGDGTASIGGRNELLEQRRQPHALEEVIDQG